jgi:hypothetical protein
MRLACGGLSLISTRIELPSRSREMSCGTVREHMVLLNAIVEHIDNS